MDLRLFNVTGLGEQRDALRLPDGGLLVVGSLWEISETHVFVARFTPSGALDPAFGASGVATYDLGQSDSKGAALALDTQGRVILGGATDQGASVVRLASNGSVDPSFGTGGKTFLATPSGAQWTPKQAFVLSNGDVAVCGATYDKLVYAVLDSSGTAKVVHELSAASAAAGVISPTSQSSAHSFDLQPDGSFVGVQHVTGPDGTANLALLRTTASAALDPAFGSGGVQMVSVTSGDDVATALLVQSDGGILVAGYWHSHFGPSSPARPYLARLLPNGSYDASFGNGGTLFLDSSSYFGALSSIVPTSISLAPDGGILVTASWYDSAALYVVRANGTLDTRYSGGVLPLGSTSNLNVGDPYDLVVAANGTFVMAVEGRDAPYYYSKLGLASGDLLHPRGFGQSLAGTAGDDRLEATSYLIVSDTFAAGAGNDVMIGHLGWDSFDGGAGTDTVVYPLGRANYTATRTSTGWNVSGIGTSDSLVDVERLAFNDGTQVALDIAGNAGQAYRLYQAAFDRVPDGGGLSFWIHELDAGRALEWVAALFAESREFAAAYGPLDNKQFVTQLYSNVLHRAPDGGGLAFWQGVLDGGEHTRAWVLAGFSESQENQVNVIGVIEHGIGFTPLA
jgi:uncharacterized delta-60 repeat protein